MKEKVKCKGRPKGKSKQLTFNKTAYDRKNIVKTPKVNKVKESKVNKRKKATPADFIDDPNDASDASEHSLVFKKKKPQSTKKQDQDEESMSEYSDPGSLHLDSDGDSFDEEEHFYATTHRPVCFICYQDVEEFQDLAQCQYCEKECHQTCYESPGCENCIVETLC